MKNIKIEAFPLINYSLNLKVIEKFISIYQRSRKQYPYEKDMFDLTYEVYYLECPKEAVVIKIEDHFKDFWVKIKETKTQYSFKIWYK